MRYRAGEKPDFHEIPVTPKKLVLEQTELFHSSFLPPGSGEVIFHYTSGSTGRPMKIRKTTRQIRAIGEENVRMRKGWGIKKHQRVAQILYPDEKRPRGWHQEMQLKNGKKIWKLTTLNADDALHLFLKSQCSLAHAFPSIMLGVLQRSIDKSLPQHLQLIGTVSEVVPDELRELVRKFPGCRLMDHYGSEESGLMAVQCPLCDAYHPADRSVKLEILAENGTPAKPGEMGRVVVTSLLSYAMPLIRYETGDYAIPAKPGGCRRSTQTIARIIGRESALFKLPNGGKVAVMLPSSDPVLAGIRQFKMFQTSFTDVEFHYISCSDDVVLEDSQVQSLVDKYISPHFKVRSVPVSEIPRLPNGKYLLHECLI